MTELRKKLKLALDEARLLVLGGQILLGFQYQSVLQPGFDRLPRAYQYLKIGALLGMLLTMLLLMWPAAYHQIAVRGEASPLLQRFVTLATTAALLPFAFVLGSEVLAVNMTLLGPRIAAVIAVSVTLTALFFWYGLEWVAMSHGCGKRERMMSAQQQHEPTKPTELFDKIEHVLTECRVVIPGAQALLGFQLIAMLTEGFAKLPHLSQYVHCAAMLLIGVSMVLLMTPAAYHRIVVAGESSEEFWRHARRMLLSGMAVLAIGLSTELYVVIQKLMTSRVSALIVSIVVLLAFFATWFGYPLIVRRRQRAANEHFRAAPEQGLETQ